MADVVTSQVLENGPRNAVMSFTSVSDGTGETNVVKVNATSSGPLGVVVQGQPFYPGVHLQVVGIFFDIIAMQVVLRWEANTPDNMLVLGGVAGYWPFISKRNGFQGIKNPASTGATGSITFSTLNANAGGSYTIILEMTKNVPQS